jgi:hypothetical protein
VRHWQCLRKAQLLCNRNMHAFGERLWAADVSNASDRFSHAEVPKPWRLQICHRLSARVHLRYEQRHLRKIGNVAQCPKRASTAQAWSIHGQVSPIGAKSAVQHCSHQDRQVPELPTESAQQRATTINNGPILSPRRLPFRHPGVVFCFQMLRLGRCACRFRLCAQDGAKCTGIGPD